MFSDELDVSSCLGQPIRLGSYGPFTVKLKDSLVLYWPYRFRPLNSILAVFPSIVVRM